MAGLAEPVQEIPGLEARRHAAHPQGLASWQKAATGREAEPRVPNTGACLQDDLPECLANNQAVQEQCHPWAPGLDCEMINTASGDMWALGV